MAVTRISRAFKDITLSFVPHPVTKDLQILKNENAIRRSIRNLVQTIPTERFFNPILGSNVKRSLFDFIDVASASTVQLEIENAIENFESRIENLIVEVKPLYDENAFDVSIIFDIIGQEIPTQQFSFILEATR